MRRLDEIMWVGFLAAAFRQGIRVRRHQLSPQRLGPWKRIFVFEERHPSDAAVDVASPAPIQEYGIDIGVVRELGRDAFMRVAVERHRKHDGDGGRDCSRVPHRVGSEINDSSCAIATPIPRNASRAFSASPRSP